VLDALHEVFGGLLEALCVAVLRVLEGVGAVHAGRAWSFVMILIKFSEDCCHVLLQLPGSYLNKVEWSIVLMGEVRFYGV